MAYTHDMYFLIGVYDDRTVSIVGYVFDDGGSYGVTPNEALAIKYNKHHIADGVTKCLNSDNTDRNITYVIVNRFLYHRVRVNAIRRYR